MMDLMIRCPRCGSISPILDTDDDFFICPHCSHSERIPKASHRISPINRDETYMPRLRSEASCPSPRTVG